MKLLTKLYLMALTVALTALTASAKVQTNESLNYRVMYKWGLVQKQAGHVNLATRPGDNGSFRSLLTAASEKWADGLYKVRDTLRGTIDVETYEPSFYEKISHEGGKYKRDVITYSRTGKKVVGTCRRTRQKSDKEQPTTTSLTLEADGLTLDMLSAFYYMRGIDYPKMKQDQSVAMTVFSGKRKEKLTITYHGRQTLKINDKSYSAYYITFRFTGDGGKKTSDDMHAWISTDADRIPLKLEGSLAVGKVQCFFTGRG
jgi:hypothetical protein